MWCVILREAGVRTILRRLFRRLFGTDLTHRDGSGAAVT